MNRPAKPLRRGFNLDPRTDKQIIKEKITHSILDQVVGASREEVYRAVDADYERLLLGASVVIHIPVLVEGEVRAGQRRKRVRGQVDL